MDTGRKNVCFVVGCISRDRDRMSQVII